MAGIIKNAIANLKGHKLRLVVAFLWIIVGITSVIFVNAFGNAVKKEINKSFEKVSPNVATILFEPDWMHNDNATKGIYSNDASSVALRPFTSSDKQELTYIDGVEKVETNKDKYSTAFTTEQYFDMYFGKNTASAGVTYPKDENSKVKILKGRNLESIDSTRNTVIVPLEVSKLLMASYNDTIIGKGITINGKIYEVVGIYDDTVKYSPEDKEFVKVNPAFGDVTPLYMSKDTFNNVDGYRLESNEIGSLKIKIAQGYSSSEVAQQCADKMGELHPDIPGTYKVEDQKSIMKQIENVTGKLDDFVKIITVIAMLVGGIGIMNIMYVSVMERHREIGIRRALGAKKRDILFQFLFESVFITSIGGVLGIIVGVAVTLYSRNFTPFRPIISISGIIAALLVMIVTGIISGLVPAMKAAKLDPIEAIYK